MGQTRGGKCAEEMSDEEAQQKSEERGADWVDKKWRSSWISEKEKLLEENVEAKELMDKKKMLRRKSRNGQTKGNIFMRRTQRKGPEWTSLRRRKNSYRHMQRKSAERYSLMRNKILHQTSLRK